MMQGKWSAPGNMERFFGLIAMAEDWEDEHGKGSLSPDDSPFTDEEMEFLQEFVKAFADDLVQAVQQIAKVMADGLANMAKQFVYAAQTINKAAQQDGRRSENGVPSVDFLSPPILKAPSAIIPDIALHPYNDKYLNGGLVVGGPDPSIVEQQLEQSLIQRSANQERIARRRFQ